METNTLQQHRGHVSLITQTFRSGWYVWATWSAPLIQPKTFPLGADVNESSLSWVSLPWWGSTDVYSNLTPALNFNPAVSTWTIPLSVSQQRLFSAFEINDVSLYDSISLPQLLPGNNRKRTRKQNAISFLSQRFGCSKVYRLPSASPFSCVHFISGGCQSSGCFQNETTRTETEDRVSKRGCLTLMLEIIWCANPGEICLFPLVTLVHFTQLIWPQMCYGHSTTLVIATTTATSFTTDFFSTPKAHQKCFNTVKSSQIIFLVSFCTLM